ncbi:hypothetical protein PIB30_051477 [Stylosanthes scabra]|uniref:Uncharacterized protein n=1 Tax=Stylosanthes scabra TaxID=79078 RepID=A0ABU6WIZ3_9FABA|nr:hypothetical protein [Stylosanthes scabra]
MPTTNQSEVTLNRAVLIHYIMSSQEVRVEKVIVDAMMNIINKLHTTKPHLAFPNIIAGLCEEMEEDMANLNKNQTEFYDSILAQQAAYGGKKICGWNNSNSTKMKHVHSLGLQQDFPSLVPITPAKIPRAIRNNFRAEKPLFEGMLRPWPPEGSTSAPGQQDPRQ